MDLTDAELQNLIYTYRPVEWASAYIEPTEDLVLDEWQKRFLEDERRRLLLLIHRQGGKSTVVSIKAVHRAIFRDNQTILLFSPTQRQSSELFYRVRKMVKSVPEYESQLTVDNVTSLELRNGSRIISLPGTSWNVRGYKADLVIIDEAAGVPDAVFDAVSPMLLTTNGQLVIVSTPQSKSGDFYRAYMSDVWGKYVVRASDNPRMQAPDKVDFLNTELLDRGSRIYSQEYECEFLDDMDIGRIRRSWWRFYDIDSLQKLRSRSSDIYISWDTASKIKELNDYSVGTVWLRIRDDHYLLEMVKDKMLFPELVKAAIDLNNKYRPTYNLIEDKSSGTALIQQLHEQRPNMPIKPIDPGSMDKGQRLDISTPAIEGGHVFLPASVIMNGDNEVLIPTSSSQEVMDDMARFPAGEHDDIVDSCTQYLMYIRGKMDPVYIEFL